MGKRLVRRRGPVCYHVMSRIVTEAKNFSENEKRMFYRLMQSYADFSGIHLLTYALMDNHFHMLIEIPKRPPLPEAEVIRRMRLIYTDAQVDERIRIWKDLKERGVDYLVHREQNLLRNRMYNMSAFIGSIKQRFSRGYNYRHRRFGTLWCGRFKSVLVEGSGEALMTMAAYIDLNSIRGGLADAPEDFRWCGYGAAVAGRTNARAGICRIMRHRNDTAPQWKAAHVDYRLRLHMDGEQRECAGDGTRVRRGIDQRRVARVIKQGGKLSKGEYLRCRVRYFSDGVALGSKAFIEEVFAEYRSYFSSARKSGARPLRFGKHDSIYTLRDLQKAPIQGQ